jgi:hypothetical protein
MSARTHWHLQRVQTDKQQEVVAMQMHTTAIPSQSATRIAGLDHDRGAPPLLPPDASNHTWTQNETPTQIRLLTNAVMPVRAGDAIDATYKKQSRSSKLERCQKGLQVSTRLPWTDINTDDRWLGARIARIQFGTM